MIEKNYPGAVVVGNATNKYNCHAFAWAGSKFVWMNDSSIYWEDGSYELEGHDSQIESGKRYTIFISSFSLVNTFRYIRFFCLLYGFFPLFHF